MGTIIDKINEEIEEAQIKESRKALMLEVLEMMEQESPLTEERVNKFFGFSDKDSKRLLNLLKWKE